MAGWVAGVAAGCGQFLTEIRYGAVGLPCRLGRQVRKRRNNDVQLVRWIRHQHLRAYRVGPNEDGGLKKPVRLEHLNHLVELLI